MKWTVDRVIFFTQPELAVSFSKCCSVSWSAGLICSVLHTTNVSYSLGNEVQLLLIITLLNPNCALMLACLENELQDKSSVHCAGAAL